MRPSSLPLSLARGAPQELKLGPLLSRRYNLGPNGGIMTALNLFTTKFDQVLSHVEKRANDVECALPFDPDPSRRQRSTQADPPS